MILHGLVVVGTARGVTQQDYRSVDRALLGGGALSPKFPLRPSARLDEQEERQGY